MTVKSSLRLISTSQMTKLKFCIPAGVPHGDTTIGGKPFLMRDIFRPVREDLVKKARRLTYLR